MSFSRKLETSFLTRCPSVTMKVNRFPKAGSQRHASRGARSPHQRLCIATPSSRADTGDCLHALLCTTRTCLPAWGALHPLQT